MAPATFDVFPAPGMGVKVLLVVEYLARVVVLPFTVTFPARTSVVADDHARDVMTLSVEKPTLLERQVDVEVLRMQRALQETFPAVVNVPAAKMVVVFGWTVSALIAAMAEEDEDVRGEGSDG